MSLPNFYLLTVILFGIIKAKLIKIKISVPLDNSYREFE